VIPVFQTKFTDRGEKGNCLAACIASILEVSLEEVPAIEELELHERASQLQALLFKHNKVCFDKPEGGPPHDDQYYITGYEVPSLPGIDHAVITKNGEIVHDPRGELKLELGVVRGYYLISDFFVRIMPPWGDIQFVR
jgi:hypothetical protein